MRHRSLVGALVLALVLGMAGCGDQADDSSSPGDEGPASGAVDASPDEDVDKVTQDFGYPEVFVAAEHMEVWARLIMAGVDESIDLAGNPTSQAASLLSQLDFLLRNHVAFVAFATDAHIANQDEAFQAATHSVEENRNKLTEKIAVLYDEELATTFEEHWRRFDEQFYRYARGVRAGDETLKQQAFEELEKLVREIANYFSDLTGGLIEATKLEEALIINVEATTAMITDQKPGDTVWFEKLEKAVDSMKEPAEILATAIAQDNRLEGDANSKASLVRADLAARMAATSWYTSFLSRGILNEQQTQREPVRALLEENTSALREVVAEIFDEETALRFADLWLHHNDLFVDLIEAVKGPEGDSEAILDELATWAADIAKLLAEATNGALSESTMEGEAEKHVQTIEDVIRTQADVT